jgi:hypothetical protein
MASLETQPKQLPEDFEIFVQAEIISLVVLFRGVECFTVWVRRWSYTCARCLLVGITTSRPLRSELSVDSKRGPQTAILPIEQLIQIWMVAGPCERS